MARLKMSLYHCYHQGHVKDFDNLLALDAANGIESAAIMWGCESPPPAAILPMCTGNMAGFLCHVLMFYVGARCEHSLWVCWVLRLPFTPNNTVICSFMMPCQWH